MDITQGKWEVEECRGLFTVITNDEPICVFYLLQEEDHHYQEFENAEANAKEFVRRWNAFENDGLVDELVGCLVELVDIIDGGTVMDTFTTQPAKAAIAKVKA